jgi:hypothetical protein
LVNWALFVNPQKQPHILAPDRVVQQVSGDAVSVSSSSKEDKDEWGGHARVLAEKRKIILKQEGTALCT